jgi:hypothetical protein
VDSESFPVEVLRLPPDAVLSARPEGKPFSFVSPIRLPQGKICALAVNDEGYDVEVHGCFGFSYSLKYHISGIIRARRAA